MKHKIIKITPNLYQLGIRSFPVYLSLGEIGMIIEGGTGSTFDIIVSQINNMGIDPDKIKYIALTHTHGDHIGGLPGIKKIWPHIKVLGSETGKKQFNNDNFVKEFMETDKMLTEILLEMGEIPTPPEGMSEYRFKIDRVVSEGDIIDLGNDIRWRVLDTPGHSPCHLSFFEEKEQCISTGDATGYFDPEKDAFWPNYFYSLEAYCESIKKMMDISPGRVLLGHNGVIRNDSDYFRKALNATEEYHTEMLNRIDRGEDKKDIYREKADWIYDLGSLAHYNILTYLCNVMIKNSIKDRGKDLF